MTTTTDYRAVAPAEPTVLSTRSSSVAWPAIIGGAVAAAAVSLILVILGSGLGLSFASPYSDHTSSMIGFTIKTAVWLIIMQWVSSAVGGYLTGRLRHKSVNIHTDESFFRDTAHGFLAWSLATLFTAGFLASAVSSIVGAGADMAPSVMAAAHIRFA